MKALQGKVAIVTGGSREIGAAMADRGRIVFSSSVTGVVALPNCSAYAVTKAVLRHMPTVLALELVGTDRVLWPAGGCRSGAAIPGRA